MSDTPRKKPYCWTTWLTKLLAGEDRCWFKAWYKVHHKYEKTPDEDRSKFEEWNARHDALTRKRAGMLKAQGYVVRLEDDAEFRLIGRQVDVSGKPDIVALRDGDALVSDAKGGQRKASHHWQVLFYMFALPLAWLQGHKLTGELVYPDSIEPVRALGIEEKAAIVQAINRVGADIVPKANPSPSECRFCDVASCEYRYDRGKEEGDASRYF